MRSFKLFILIFLTFNYSISWSQKDSTKARFTDNLYISGTYSRGAVFVHRGALSSLIQEYTRTYILEIGKSTPGTKPWHSLYDYPNLGIGILHTNLGNAEIFGQANALYGFYETPFVSHKSFDFSFKFGFGLAHISKKFDIKENIYNVAIGSNFNYLVHIAFDLSKTLFNGKMSIKTGLGLNHMSNGKIQTPNLGLNLIDWHLTTKYYIGEKKTRINKPFPKRDNHTFMVIAAGGIKEFTEPGFGKYFAGNITTEYLHRVMKKYSLGFGFDCFYDDVIYHRLELLEDSKARQHAYRAGIHGTYAVNYSKVSFIIQMGAYIEPYFNDISPIYHRIGFRAKLTEHIVANVTMKTHWGKADIVEFGLGYYITRN